MIRNKFNFIGQNEHGETMMTRPPIDISFSDGYYIRNACHMHNTHSTIRLRITYIEYTIYIRNMNATATQNLMPIIWFSVFIIWEHHNGALIVRVVYIYLHSLFGQYHPFSLTLNVWHSDFVDVKHSGCWHCFMFGIDSINGGCMSMNIVAAKVMLAGIVCVCAWNHGGEWQ